MIPGPLQSASHTRWHCDWRWHGPEHLRTLRCRRCGRRHTFLPSTNPRQVYAWCQAPDVGPRWLWLPRRLWARARFRIARPRRFAAALLRFTWYMLSHRGRGYLLGARYRRRWAQCRDCQHRQNNLCEVCQCNLRGVVIAKLRWGTEQCPLPEPKWWATHPAGAPGAAPPMASGGAATAAAAP